jgi:anti-sigma-K factor RskA
VDIQAYISSGVLELYVFSQLPSKEREEVEQMRIKYPEVETEIARIEMLLEKFAFDFEKKPKKELKNRILSKIDEIEKKNKAIAKTIPLYSPWQYRTSIAASVLLFATTCILGYTLWQKTTQNNALLTENTRKMEQIQQELAISKNPNYHHITLASIDTTKQQSALVFWNPTSQEVYLEMGLLPALPADKQYQLWAIIEGKPSDMGVFDAVANLQKMKVAKNVQAFAITIEPKGGSKAPTLTAMVVLGKVS